MKPTPENNPDLRAALRHGAHLRVRIAEAAARVEKRGDYPSVNRVQAICGVGRLAVSDVLRAWRKGLFPSPVQGWGDDLPAVLGLEEAKPAAAEGEDAGADLAAKVRAAKTDGDREDLAHELAALVAAGEIGHQQAREIRGALAEARLAASKKRELEPPPEDPTKLLLASAEAMAAARALDWIVSDEIRDEALAFVAQALERDLELHPNVDEGGA